MLGFGKKGAPPPPKRPPPGGGRPPPRRQGPRTRIVTVVGSRDGVGKTTFATNVALSFLRETKRRVLLIDLDINYCGDVQQLIGLREVKSLVEIAPYVDRLDPNLLRGFITPHQSGLGVMQLYRDKADLGKINAELFEKVLSLLSRIFDFIVIDGGAVLNNTLVKGLERSSIIFLLTTPDLMVLNQTRIMVDELQRLHFPKEMLKVILNAYEPRSVISLEMVTQKLQRQILTTVVRDDALVRQAAISAAPFVLSQPRSMLTRNYDDFVRNLLERRILDRLAGLQKPKGVHIAGDPTGQVAGGGPTGGGSGSGGGSSQSEAAAKKNRRDIDPATQRRTEIKRTIHQRLLETVDIKKLDAELRNNDDRTRILRQRTERAIISILDEEGSHITSREERARIVKEVLDEALGLGPLEDLIRDESVTEIMVNGKDQTYIERKGRLTLADCTFTDDAQLLAVIERIVAPIGRRIDEKSPMVDARLQDGSRVNAIIPPLAIDGAALTIRKFAKDPFKVKDLVKFGSMTENMADFLRACVEAHLNILISGGTGSGKTTLLNVMSSFIPENERIITVEDSAELQLGQPHVVRLETRPPNIEGEGAITIRDLVKNTLRMRPDRIVVGECRGAEALDMLQAMNTGHDGSLTTLHSNSPRDCIARMETLVMFAGLDLPSKAIREQIAAAIHVIVQQSRLGDGSRKITAISEITGMEGQTITLQDIFVYKQTGVDDNGKAVGKFVPTGFIPKFIEKLEATGIKIPKGLFRGQGL